jgi:hypothetical protein
MTILWVLVPPYDDALQHHMPRSFHHWLEMIRYGFADQIFIYVAVEVAAHGYEHLKRVRTEERKMSNLLRAAFGRDSGDLIPLQDELKFAREYLDLEKICFGSRLQVAWIIAPRSFDCWSRR